MAANIYVYCPASADGRSRCDLEEHFEAFSGGAAEDCGAGAGIVGFNPDYQLVEGEDPHAWADLLQPFLADIGVRPGTVPNNRCRQVPADGLARAGGPRS